MDAAPPSSPPVPAVIDETVVSLARAPGHATWQVAAPFKFTSFDGRSAWLAGARLGLLKRERHVLSLAAFKTMGGANARAGSPFRRIDFRYLGVVLGWESDGLALFQSYGHTLVGVGQGEAGLRTKPLLVLEPELGIAWKVTRYVRGLVGVSWRGVWGNTLDTVPRRAFDGWAVTLGLALATYPTLVPPEAEGPAP